MYYLGTGWLHSHANALFGDVGPNKVSGHNLESPMNVWESLVLRSPGKPPCLGSEKFTRMRMIQRVMRTIKCLSSFSRTPPRMWHIGKCSKWRRFIPKPRKRSCCSMHKLHPTWRECLSKWGSWTCTVIFYLVDKKIERIAPMFANASMNYRVSLCLQPNASIKRWIFLMGLIGATWLPVVLPY